MSTPLTDPARWAVVDRLLTAALDVPVAEREAYVLAECAGDPALLAQLRRLLRAQDTPSPLDDERSATVRDALLREATRDWEETPFDAPRVPRFRIEREIGRGGMGTVYLGARDDGAYEQRVAIKVLRRGVDTDDVLARFHRERQILASFDHPHIARLLDGGATADGRPFLAMEYVDGAPLTEWCDAQALAIPARLALFDQVCSAVAYAHQRLVVHRDLKPSNILVDRTGAPKLLDFGIAKLLDEPERDRLSPVTRTGHIYATPRYASPEQLRREAVTTATDVYLLGVLLYEMLAGVHPMAHVEPTLEAMRQAFRVDAIRAPSAAARRPALRGDLDAIVRKAMRVDAADRYPSVAALREDLERYRRRLPVEARVGARWYRVRRAAWRYRGALLVSGVALTAGTAYLLSLRSYARELEVERNRAQVQAQVAEAERARADSALLDATRQRVQAEGARAAAGVLGVEADAQRANAERERDAAREAERRATLDALRAQQTTTFLVDLFRTPGDSTRVRGDTVTARTLLERGAARVRTDLSAQPEVLASLLAAIGTASSRLGLIGYAEHFDAEIDALERAYGPTDPRLPAALSRQGAVFEVSRDFVGAAARYAAAARLQRTNRAADSARATTLFRLGNALTFAERADSADVVLREAVALRGPMGPQDGERYVNLQAQLAALYRRQGRVEAADSLLRGALALHVSDTTRVLLLNNYGSLLVSRQRFAEAERTYREAVILSRRAFVPTDRQRHTLASNYAGVLARQAKHEAALQILEEELATHRAHFPADHWRVGSVEGAVSVQLRRMERTADAIAPRERQVAIYRQSLGESHDWTLRAWLDLAETLDDAGRTDDAVRARADVAQRAAAMTDAAARAAILERLSKSGGAREQARRLRTDHMVGSSAATPVRSTRD